MTLTAQEIPITRCVEVDSANHYSIYSLLCLDRHETFEL